MWNSHLKFLVIKLPEQIDVLLIIEKNLYTHLLFVPWCGIFVFYLMSVL